MKKFAPALSIICFLFFVNHACGQWIQTSLSGISAFALAVSGGNLFAGTGAGVFLSANNGTSWTAIDSGLSNANVSCLAAGGGKIFAGTRGGGVFLSVNNGTNWTAINSGLPANTTVYSLAISGDIIFAGTDGGVFLSANSGTSWTVINGPTIIVHSFAVNENSIFAGTNGNGIYLTTNNGTSWSAVSTLMPYNALITSFAVSGGNIFAGTGGSVYRSTDNGANWTAVDSGLPKASERPIFLSFTVSGSNIFTGAGSNSSGWGGGVFLSTNNGASWTAAVDSGPLRYDTVYSLAVNGSNIFAGTGSSIFTETSSSGVWRRPLSEMVSILPPNQKFTPLQTRLRIVASGALHSGIALNYSIQSRCLVHLGLYTISGKQVVALDEGIREPGNYSVNFGGNRIPAGLYMCRFQAGGYQESNRLMVVK